MSSDPTTTSVPPEKPHRLRHRLRILWSLFFGVMIVVQGVLWVRSYSVMDSFDLCLGGSGIGGVSVPGVMLLACGKSTVWSRFSVRSEPTDAAEVQFVNGLFGSDGFGTAADKDTRLISAPYYFIVVLLAALGISPWLRFSRRFSLRTMLIATTVIAAVLGAVVWGMR